MARYLSGSLMMVAIFLCATTQGQNLLTNGDFEQGNTGFFTSYTASNDLYPAGTYVVGSNLRNHHSGGASYRDHTTGNGLMLIINGASIANLTVWEQTVSVTSNQVYDFSGWVASWGMVNGSDPSPAQLRFYVNGAQVGADFLPVAANGHWTQFSVLWNSGLSTAATIRIVDVNLIPGGNDFTLDDLKFTVPSVLVSGKLAFDKLLAVANPQNLTFTFRPNDGSDAFSRTLTLAPTGEFEIKDVPKKAYTLHIKPEHHLAKNVPLDATKGDVSGITATLLPGDANNDNHVDIFDLATLAEAFNSQEGDPNWNANADFNGNHEVSIFDLAILAETFNQDGDP